MTENAKLATLDSGVSKVVDPRDASLVLTVIVPVYNEVGTIFELLARVLAAPYAKQVIVVDDGSTDGTAGILLKWRDHEQFELLRHERNLGRGQAIRTGLKHARGQFSIIQDADLEYDPQDYPLLIEPLLAGKAQVVFGSRYLGGSDAAVMAARAGGTRGAQTEDRVKAGLQREDGVNAGLQREDRVNAELQREDRVNAELQEEDRVNAGLQAPGRKRFRWGAAGLNSVVRLLYGTRLTDVSTSFTAFSTELLRKLDLQCERFEFCPEVTAKLCRQGEKILEVPIHFESRFTGAGKKRPWADGLHALATLWHWRRWWSGQKIKVGLIVASGPKAGMEIPVSTSEFRIGRGEHCHVQLLGGSTAELHCHIAVGNGSATLFAIKDEGYARGTRLNGEPVHRCRLRNYDRIKIASLEFDVRLTADETVVEEPVPCAAADSVAGTVAAIEDEGAEQVVLWVEDQVEDEKEWTLWDRKRPDRSAEEQLASAARGTADATGGELQLVPPPRDDRFITDNVSLPVANPWWNPGAKLKPGRGRGKKRPSFDFTDRLLIFAIVNLGFVLLVLVLPIPSWSGIVSWTVTSWLRLRYSVLPHWWDFGWFRLSIVGVLILVLTLALLYRGRKNGGQ